MQTTADIPLEGPIKNAGSSEKNAEHGLIIAQYCYSVEHEGAALLSQ